MRKKRRFKLSEDRVSQFSYFAGYAGNHISGEKSLESYIEKRRAKFHKEWESYLFGRSEYETENLLKQIAW